MVTVFSALYESTLLLKEKHMDTPRLDSEVILAHVLKCSRLKVMTEGQRALSLSEYEHYKQLINCRAQGMPVAYITGHKEFMGLQFHVCPGVLIPRGDTEIVCETVINECLKANKTIKAADVGCGSGAIGISIAYYSPNAEVTLIDISDTAFEIAQKNSAENQVNKRVRVLKGNLLEPCIGESFDVIVSNPPYIESDAIPSLSRDVRDYEPLLALDGGEDGLDYYRRITSQAAGCIAKGGLLVYEIGCCQAEDVKSIMNAEGFNEITVYKDLAGLDRCVAGKRI